MHKNIQWKATLALPVILSLALLGANLISRAEDKSPPDHLFIAQRSIVNPQRTYENVWEIINERFFDPTFNGQDWERWHHRYDGKLKTIEDSHKAIETALASLGDKYTRFLDKDAFSDEKQQIDARLFGVGIQIGMDKSQRVIVIAPIEGTPAARAGVLAGDVIAEVNGKSTNGMSVDEAAKAIKGLKGTQVLLTLLRKNERIKARMLRDEIHISSIPPGNTKMLDSDIGYVRLTSFISKDADSEVKDALKKLSGAKGIILDLRDNPGGLLTNAVQISNMFLENRCNIVFTVDSDGYKTPETADGKPVTHQPLAVLINKGSASASEITSGALKDNGRAVLIGQRTFGKGLVQGISRLDDESGVNYTIARYLTPNDTDINKIGIAPDILVELNDSDIEKGNGPWWIDIGDGNEPHKPEDLSDLQLRKAVEYLKAHVSDNKVAVGKTSTDKDSTR